MDFINKGKGLIIDLNGNISSLSKNGIINKGFIKNLFMNKWTQRSWLEFINRVYK